MGTCVHFSRSLPSNKRWLGGKPCQGRQPPKAGAAGPPLQGLPPRHTRPPRSTAGNISSAGCLKTGPQYSSTSSASKTGGAGGAASGLVSVKGSHAVTAYGYVYGGTGGNGGIGGNGGAATGSH